ncbi:MAG: carbohydrate kinase family protein [Patescibacteria group bacterium]
MLNNKITTIGGSVYDIMFYTDNILLLDNRQDLLRQKLIAFEYGAKIYGKKVYFAFGGGGANTAMTFASLGIKTQIITAIGEDMLGRSIMEHLKKHRIATKLVQIKPQELTGISFVINVGQGSEHVIFAVRGANDAIDLTPHIVKKINTPWLYLTALGINFKTKLDHIFEQARRKKIKVAWNPASQQIALGLARLKPYLEKTYVLLLNRDEALELLSRGGKKKINNNINWLLKNLHKSGQKITVITDGAKGAHVYDGQQVYFRPATRKKTVNTTGAGDAFGSGFVAGLIKYGSRHISKALHLGIINSGSVVTKIGAQAGILHSKDLSKYKL